MTSLVARCFGLTDGHSAFKLPWRRAAAADEPASSSSFDNMPQLVLSILGSQLSVQDLGRLACVNRATHALCQQDHLWEAVYMQLRGLGPFDAVPDADAALVKEAGSYRKLMLHAELRCTAPVGGPGGAPFYSNIYSNPSTPSPKHAHSLLKTLAKGRSGAGLLAGPEVPISSDTYPVVTAVRIWASQGSYRQRPHIRAVQLQHRLPLPKGTHRKQQEHAHAWTPRTGASDERGRYQSPPTHTLTLERGEHVVFARCFEGPCQYARLVLLGIQFTTSKGRSVAYGDCDMHGGAVRKVTEFTFPRRLVSFWGRSGYVIDQLGFDYL